MVFLDAVLSQLSSIGSVEGVKRKRMLKRTSLGPGCGIGR